MSSTPLPESLKQEAQVQGFLATSTYWTDVYLCEDAVDGLFLHAVLMPSTCRSEVLAREDWESHVGDGLPGFWRSGDRVEYARHCCAHDDALPIVFVHDNSGIGPEILPEIVEEFRHMLELRPNSDHTKFHKLISDGSLEPAAEVSESSVRIRTKYLMQYLAARQLDLVRFMDSRVFHPGDHTAAFADEIGDSPCERRGPNYRLRWWCNHGREWGMGDQTLSMMHGKLVIPALPRELSGIWPWNEEDVEEYQEFTIGEDDVGRQVRFTCDPDKLGNFFGANPDAPNYLTPVWFRREVLQKYYADTDKYEVTDGHLWCGGLWSVRIDNDNTDGFVMVWLGDLGRDIPSTERDHWKAHNVVLPRTGSQTAIRRQLMGQWADAESPVFVFRQEYSKFRDAWRERFDWDLLCELEGPNAAALDRLRTPLNDTDKEFEDLIKDLHLALVEALNAKQLRAELAGDTKDMKSISLLERWLCELDYPSVENDIGFLRNLNEVRSLSSHLRSRKHEERLHRLGVTEDRIATMQQFYRSAATLLGNLRAWIGDSQGDDESVSTPTT
ncbi:MAG: hypothetical protein OXF61_10305 [Acidimicrobiaceae bacterium]|nr:hypothetical protein [Acidimicrobiaceae bacterium]